MNDMLAVMERQLHEEAGSELPVFSFARVGLLDQIRFDELQAEISKLMKVAIEVQKIAQEDPERILDEGQIEQLGKKGPLQLKMLEFIAPCIRHVPRSWLVEDAPEEIQWGTFDALNYIQSDKQSSLMMSFNVERNKRYAPKA